MADTPEASDYTSIQQRIRQWHKTQQARDLPKENTPSPALMPLVKQHRDPHHHSIGFTLRDYIELVDWAGRQLRDDKRGAISPDTPPILYRLGIDPGAYVDHIKGEHQEQYPRMLGRLEKIQQACDELKQCFIKGMSQSRLLYTG